MPRGDDDIDEGPSEADVERFSDATRECPECKAQLHDDVEICWKCGHMLSEESKGPPRWVIALAIVLLVLIALFMVRSIF